MARAWLHLRPLDVPARATADIDLGIDRKGLGLTSSTEKVRPLLEARDYVPYGGDEGFRFGKEMAPGEVLVVDLFVAKGASRSEPPVLEKGVETLAAPGLTYAIERGPYFVEAMLHDGTTRVEVELPLPTLDAAFVLKAALAHDGVRTRADRQSRDRVDAVMLAAACVADRKAVRALSSATGKEAKRAVGWLRDKLASPSSAVARTVERHMLEEHGTPGGGEWAVQVAAQLMGSLEAERAAGLGNRRAGR